MAADGKRMKSYWIETYGCEMNKAESAAMERKLVEAGYLKAPTPRTADVVILNTCSVRATAENRIWGRIGFFGGLKKAGNLKLIITGCMAERIRDDLLETGIVDSVFGTAEKHLIPGRLTEEFPSENNDLINAASSYRFFDFHQLRSDTTRSFVPIMNGCDNFCSYCIVPYVRGRETSRPVHEIFREIETLDREGFSEITLLGQNVNSYSYRKKDIRYDFADLLEAISGKVDSIKWIRFLTSHPKNFSEKIVRVLSSSNRFCRYIHLPVQNGSDRILKEMNRQYDSAYYLELLEMIRSCMPDVSISTDLLVGFPGETEDDMNRTIDLMEKARFLEAFMYYYNPREGTPAAKREGQIADKEKLDRLSRIIAVQKRITKEEKARKIGTIVTALGETVSKKSSSEILGRTEHNDMIVYPGNESMIGTFATVRIEALAGNTFIGTRDFTCR